MTVSAIRVGISTLATANWTSVPGLGVYPEITGYTMRGMEHTNHYSDFTLTFSECEEKFFCVLHSLSHPGIHATQWLIATHLADHRCQKLGMIMPPV